MYNNLLFALLEFVVVGMCVYVVPYFYLIVVRRATNFAERSERPSTTKKASDTPITNVPVFIYAM
jgi:hypothetical protein